jgi:two-component system chemotaxis response regulator CheY
VVDDSAVMRSMIVKTLRAAALPLGQVWQASNGQEGLKALEQDWVDLIFADINMPVMNGEEMIERIRAVEAWRDLPIIIISTEGSQTRIDRLLTKETRFIHKPFTPETVRDVVTQMTGVCHEHV